MSETFDDGPGEKKPGTFDNMSVEDAVGGLLEAGNRVVEGTAGSNTPPAEQPSAPEPPVESNTPSDPQTSTRRDLLTVFGAATPTVVLADDHRPKSEGGFFGWIKSLLSLSPKQIDTVDLLTTTTPTATVNTNNGIPTPTPSPEVTAQPVDLVEPQPESVVTPTPTPNAQATQQAAAAAPVGPNGNSLLNTLQKPR